MGREKRDVTFCAETLEINKAFAMLKAITRKIYPISGMRCFALVPNATAHCIMIGSNRTVEEQEMTTYLNKGLPRGSSLQYRAKMQVSSRVVHISSPLVLYASPESSPLISSPNFQLKVLLHSCCTLILTTRTFLHNLLGSYLGL